MASSTFGLTVESVRAHHFPNADAFSSQSRPSLVTAGEILTEEAAQMAGALALELIDASAITANSGAYNSCRKTLRQQAAAKLVRLMTGVDPEIAKTWSEEVADWYAKLDQGGVSFLGDGATASGLADADGPASHLTTYALERDTAANMSNPVAGKLRMDDDM